MASLSLKRSLGLAGVFLFSISVAGGAAEPGEGTSPALPATDTKLVLAEYHVWHGLASHSPAFSDPPCFPDRRAYDSSDLAVIDRHITKAMAMGIHGFVVDWYGPQAGVANDTERRFMDPIIRKLLDAAEPRGFRIALLYDEGTLRQAGIPPARYEERAIADLRHGEDYFSSPAYLRLAGRPALFVFPYPEVDPHLDWARIRGALSQPVTLIDEDPNPDDWAHDEQFDGFYAWVQPSGRGWDPQGCEWGEAYLRWFYATMQSERYAAKIMIGGVWPGFDDSLAPWGQKRFISRDRGRVWQETWRLATENRAENVMIATWNDFEEGTDVEYGIDMVVDMEDPTPETLLRSSPFVVTWNPARGQRQLQVYVDCHAEPIYNELSSPGTLLRLLSGDAYEVKLWTDGSHTLSKIVKVRRQDPSGPCLPAPGF